MAIRGLLWSMTLLALRLTSAQQISTTAVCNSAFSWMDNSRGQSPCLVAAYIQGACGTGDWTVPLLPLTAGGQQQAYLAPGSPNGPDATLCTCSSAAYNLMSACAACQGGAWLMYAAWALACDSNGLLSLPQDYPTSIPVPSNTTIPGYAATDPRAWTSSTFNVTEARQIALGGAAPVYTIPPTSSSTIAPSSATSPSISNTSPSPTSSPVSRHDNTGAIVGGVVGGVLGVSLVAVLMLWLLCAQSIRKRFSKENISQPRPDVLGRAYATPTEPPPLANIVVPVPVRPYPLRPAFQSYMSTTTGGSNVGDSAYKESSEYDGTARSDVAIMERGSSQNHTSLARHDTNSSFATSLLRRVTGRWRRRAQGASMNSIGTGTVMTTTVTGMDSDTGHGSRNVSRENTTRRTVDPVPFILPSHPEEPTIVDISSSNVDRTSPYGLSAAEEKRRLNPPAYSNSVPWSGTTTQSQGSDPNASNSLLDLPSGAATAGSASHIGPLVTVGAPSTVAPMTGAARTSLPSNIILPSPFDMLSQGASSGILDTSPLPRRPPASTNLRFAVTNPSREVEM